MARRRRGADGSLELLLDTICNTFGGIVFIAMLVSVLLTQTRRRTEASAPVEPHPALSAADLVRLQAEVLEAEAEFEQIGDVAESFEAIVAQVDPDHREQVAEMLEAEREATQVASEQARLLADLATAQAARARAASKAVAAERDADSRSARAVEATRRLEAAMMTRETLLESADILARSAAESATVRTKGRAPRMRDTDKLEFGVMLKYGRMYVMKTIRGGRALVNTADFWVVEERSHNTARPLPHRGLAIRRDATLPAEVEATLGDINPREWYLALVVHPDSFEAFLELKAVLVGLGYEYRLLPTNEPVVDRGGSGGQVQ
jgi:hypothetical protein